MSYIVTKLGLFILLHELSYFRFFLFRQVITFAMSNTSDGKRFMLKHLHYAFWFVDIKYNLL